MKDSYSFDVDDEGLERSYAAHRDAYVRIFDRLGFDYVIVEAMSGAMGGSQAEEFLATAEAARTPTCAAPRATTRPTSRRCRCAPPAAGRRTTSCPPPHVEDTPGHPDHRDAGRPPQRAFPREDRPWDAGDTLKNVVVVLKHPDGTREPLAIGVPGDREVDEKRLEAQLEPAEVDGLRPRRTSPRTRRWSRATSGRRARGEERVRHPLPGRPAGRRRAPPGSPAPTRPARHVLDLVAGRDFTADGTIEAAEVRDGDPCPDCDGGRWTPPAASRWATSSSSAASTPTRSTCRCSTRTASRSRSPWAPTASGSRGRSPRSPRTPTTSSA